jgi:hypothetical protein
VIAASREWICVRPATYESAEEAKLLSKWFSGRDGDLENTTFVLLDPSGNKAISRAGRGPEMAFSNAGAFTAALKKGSAAYEAKKAERVLPTVLDFRLGLNVAASDGLALVAIVEADQNARTRISKAVAKAAWSEELHGLAHYVMLDEASVLEKLEGFEAEKKIYVLQPDTFGRTGKIVSAFAASEKKLATKLGAAFGLAQIKKASHRQHVREGKRAGISWKSKIPVSDGAAARAGRKL